MEIFCFKFYCSILQQQIMLVKASEVTSTAITNNLSTKVKPLNFFVLAFQYKPKHFCYIRRKSTNYNDIFQTKIHLHIHNFHITPIKCILKFLYTLANERTVFIQVYIFYIILHFACDKLPFSLKMQNTFYCILLPFLKHILLDIYMRIYK